MSTQSSITKIDMRQIIPWALLAFALVGLYFLIEPFVISVLSGAIFAIVLYPLQMKLVARKWQPSVAAFVLTIGTTLLILAPIVLVLWTAITDAVHFLRQFNVERFVSQIDLHFITDKLPFNVDPKALLQDILKQTGNVIGGIAQHLLRSLPSYLVALGFTLLSGFFLLMDGPKLKTWFLDNFPDALTTNAFIPETFIKTSFATVLAALAAALFQSLMICLTFYIADIPNVLLWTVVTFIFAILPLIGAAPLWLSASFYLYNQASFGMMAFMIIMGVGISLSENIIKPLIIRNSSTIHPLIVILSIFGGLQWLGPMGIFLGPVFAALVLGAFKMWVNSLSSESKSAA